MIEASGDFSSCVTESMNESCLRTSRISRARKIVNITRTLMITTKETIPSESSQTFSTTCPSSVMRRATKTVQPTSKRAESGTVTAPKVIGTEIERTVRRATTTRE